MHPRPDPAKYVKEEAEPAEFKAAMVYCLPCLSCYYRHSLEDSRS